MAAPAAAHPVPFSFVDVRIQAASLDITVVAHIFDLGHDLGIEPPQRPKDDLRISWPRAKSRRRRVTDGSSSSMTEKQER